MDLSALLIQCANQEGFPLAGVVDIDLVLGDPTSPFQKHVERFDHWIQSGYAGSMEYLVRGRDRRTNPRLLFPEAQSILCVAIPYPRKAAGASDATIGPRYARYLQGKDYHLELAEKLERVMKAVQSQWSQYWQTNTTESPPPITWKTCVDTSAVLERTWAALAGLGWIGKNTLLIHPKHGSYLFLAEVLINQKTGKGPAPLPSYCGNCTRCLSACPTQALEKPHTLNSKRCVSYWTLEKRGDLAISDDDKKKVGSWIAGCDICQEVCPFNIKPSREENLSTTSQDRPRNATGLQEWRELLLETSEDYKKRVHDSAMKRIKPAQFSRNLAISLSNAIANIRNSDSFSESELSELFELVQSRFSLETDEIAQSEWAKCLSLFPLSSVPTK